MRKSACFIHSTNMPIWKEEMLCYLLEEIVDSGLMKELEFVYVCNIGEPLNNSLTIKHPKVRIQNYSKDLSLFENATIKILHSFCLLHSDYNILYLHTKCVSYEKRAWQTKGVLSWNKYSMYCLATHHHECRQLLKVYDTVGPQFADDKVNPAHYSGNFWWARADYINKLSVDYLKDKYDPEFWLLRENPMMYNIFNLYQMYENAFAPCVYENLVTTRFQENTFYCTLQNNLWDDIVTIVNAIQLGTVMSGKTIIILEDNFLDIEKMTQWLSPYEITFLTKSSLKTEWKSIHYGFNEIHTIDITKEFLQTNCFTEKGLHIPKGFVINDLKGDPIPGKVKYIYVQYLLNGIVRHQCFSEKRITEKEGAILDMREFKHVAESEWIQKKPLTTESHYFLNSLIFSSRFYPTSTQEYKNIIHIRLDVFVDKRLLEQKYIFLIEQFFKKEDFLFLICEEENEITEYLKKNEYSFLCSEKKEKKKEQDLLNYLQCMKCSDTFIGLHPSFGGASYILFSGLQEKKKIRKILIEAQGTYGSPATPPFP